MAIKTGTSIALSGPLLWLIIAKVVIASANPEPVEPTKADGTEIQIEELPVPAALSLPMPQFISDLISGSQPSAKRSPIETRHFPGNYRQMSMERVAKSSSDARKLSRKFPVRRGSIDTENLDEQSKSKKIPLEEAENYYGNIHEGSSHYKRRTRPQFGNIHDSDAVGISMPDEYFDDPYKNSFGEYDSDPNYETSHDNPSNYERSYDIPINYERLHDVPIGNADFGSTHDTQVHQRRPRPRPLPFLRPHPFIRDPKERNEIPLEEETPFWTGVMNMLNPMNLFRSITGESSSERNTRNPPHRREHLNLQNVFRDRERHQFHPGRRPVSTFPEINQFRENSPSSHFSSFDSLDTIGVTREKRPDLSFGSQGDVFGTQDKTQFGSGFSQFGLEPNGFNFEENFSSDLPSQFNSRSDRPSSRQKSSSQFSSRSDRKSSRPKSYHIGGPLGPEVNEGELIYEDAVHAPARDPRFDPFQFKEDFPLRDDLYVGKDGNIYVKEKSSSKKQVSTAVAETEDFVGLNMYGMEKPLYQEVSKSSTQDVDKSQKNRKYSKVSRDTRRRDELYVGADSKFESMKTSAHKRPMTGNVFLGHKETSPKRGPSTSNNGKKFSS